MKDLFSPGRLLAMIVKELIQMRRDRMTFAIMFGLPIVQILLFGFVINADPRHLPSAVLLGDNGPEGRTLLQGLKNSTYFDFVRLVGTEQEGRSLLMRGEVQFVLNIPQNFSHDLLRGDKPAILLEADATDPILALRPYQIINGSGAQSDATVPTVWRMCLAYSGRSTVFEVELREPLKSIASKECTLGLNGLVEFNMFSKPTVSAGDRI